MPTATYAPITKRQQYEITWAALDTEYGFFRAHHSDIADHLIPRRPRFFVSDNNRGDRRSTKIIDSTGTMALDTFASGMLLGTVSPSSPWVRLTLSDPLLAEDYAGKAYMDDLTDRFLEVCAKSNIYDSFLSMFKDGGAFGTSPIILEEDFRRVFNATTLPVGSYRVGLGQQDQVEVLAREFRMTVRQLVGTFGLQDDDEEINWSHFSPEVKSYWDRGHKEIWVDVRHIIQPNEDYDPSLSQSRYKKYVSCYYERGSSSGDRQSYRSNTVLSEKGYDDFPVLVFRFDRGVGDAYATDCPGMTALGDLKALQHLHKRHAMAIDKMVNPPMKAVAGAESKRWSTLPGDTLYIDPMTQGAWGAEPVFQIQPNTNDLKEMIRDHQFRINQAFFVPGFLSLMSSANERDREKTAREIDEMAREKFMRTGGLAERMKHDVLSKAVNVILGFMENQGLIDDPPEHLAGADMKVEFISPMMQSQKLVGLASTERLIGFVAQIAESSVKNPDAWKKVDIDNAIDAYANGAGAPAKIMRTDEQVAAMREAEAKIRAAQAQAEMLAQGAKAARDLGQTKMGQDSALDRVAEGMAGAA